MTEPRPDAYLIVKVPAALWADRSLSLPAKAVFVAIRDRIGKNASAWPGFGTLARDCGISRNSAVRAVAELGDRGLVTVTRAGKASGVCNHYEIDPQSVAAKYTHDGHTDTDGARGNYTHAGYTQGGHTDPKYTQGGTGGIPKAVLEPVPLNLSHTESKRSGEAAASVSPGAEPSKPDGALFAEPAGRTTRPRFPDAVVEGLYAGYPRHVGRARAMTAIRAALAIIAGRNGCPDPVEWLLERVQAFAASPAGRAGQYTPHPATWFGQGRFDDDPREWQREREGNGRTPPRATPKLHEHVQVKEVI